MGDAAGQAADALDLLRLHQPLLDQAAIGDVAGDAQVTLAVHARAIAALDQPRVSGAGGVRAHAMLAARLSQGHQLAPRRVQLLFAADEQRVERPALDRVFGHAEQRARRRIGLEDDAVVVEDQHGVGGVEEDGAKLPLALEQRELRLDARRHVEQESAELDQRAAAVELADDGLDYRDDAAAVAAAQTAAVMLETAVLADGGDKALAIAGRVVERAHAGADGFGDRAEAENASERGVTRQQLAVGPRDVDAEQRALEQLAIAVIERVDGRRGRQPGRGRRDQRAGIPHEKRRAAGGGASSAR